VEAESVDPARPKVTLVVATSLDGKIATTAREPVTFTSRRDRAHLHGLRDASDALLLGAATIRAEDPPLLPTAEHADARRAAGLAELPIRAVVSATLDLPVGRALAARAGGAVVVFTIDDAPTERRSALQAAGIEVEPCGRDRVDFTRALASLARRGARRVLAEGGGDLGFSLFQADLVDEVELTICPVVIGGVRAPSPADGTGFRANELKRFTLADHRVEESEVYLRYVRRSS
jgi:2,5-diamino-6-(ribosylamino)-4(3H)-pyrimidinone 5'-phosphate reductase